MSQQLVPPFNKKEVKELAVEGVNEGIAEGKVNIPAGGTKLYKHQLTASGGAPYNTITVISTQKDAFATNIDSYDKASEIINSLVVRYELVQVNTDVCFKEIGWSWGDQRLVISTKGLESPTSFNYYGNGSSDTVTEL